MIALSLAVPAFAVDPSCAAPYSPVAWDDDMTKIERLLAASEHEHAGEALAAVYRGVSCLDTPASSAQIARFARLRATWAFFDQDEEAAIEWGLTAREADATLAWDQPEDHPLRALIDGAEPAASVVADGAWLAGRRAIVTIDGHAAPIPVATPEIPHLVQVIDGSGAVVRAYWQDGAAFPADLVGPAPTREGNGLVAAASAGGLGLAAVGLYALAAGASGDVHTAGTTGDLVRARNRTNTLVVGAGLAGAAAVGVGVGAVLVEF